jgi:hypothetical protein
MRYVPVHELGSEAHVMIDGAARPHTALTLSHWPRSPTPKPFRRDLSAQIVLAALGAGHLASFGVDVATIDHYDEDGVIALAFSVVDGLADRHSELLVEAARVGDFGVVHDRRAALISFTLAALSDPSRTPLRSVRAHQNQRATHLEVCGLAAAHALTILTELAEDPLRFESLWRDEADAFDAAVEGIGDWIEIEDVPDHDLAIVRVAPDHSLKDLDGWGDLIHPAAVNSVTERMRIATIAAGRMQLRYRYETWVRLETRRLRPRVDLSGLATVLTGLEPGAVEWSFDGAGAIRPAVKTNGNAPSGVPADLFVEEAKKAFASLDSGPPAWDPYV